MAEAVESLITEKISAEELLQNHLKSASLLEINSAFDDAISRIWTEDPEIGSLTLYKKIAALLPPHKPSEKLTEVFEVISSPDPNTAKIGRQVMLFLNLGTVLTALEPYLTTDLDANNELVQHVLSGLVDRQDKLNPNIGFPQQFHQFTRQISDNYIAKKEGMPVGWVQNGQADVVKGIVNQEFRENPFGLNNEQLADLAHNLARQTGIPVESLEEYLMGRNALIPTPGQKTPLDNHLSELRKRALADIMETITIREKEVLEYLYGVDEDGVSHTREEAGQHFGVDTKRIRQIENKALRKLRHPARRKYLVNLL